MEALGTDKLVAALGLAPEVARFYLRILPLSGSPVADVARQLDVGRAEFDVLAADLIASGALVIDDERLDVLAPPQALSLVIERAADRARSAYEQLLSVSRAVPHLVADGEQAQRPRGADYTEPIDGEVTHSGSVGETMAGLIQRTSGSIRWLRPDQWTQPWEEDLKDLLAAEISRGRSVRGIYPVRALTDAPAVIQARGGIGEEIRLLPEVPTRLLVIGSSHALVPEPLGNIQTTPRILVRQQGLVQGFAMLFDQLWSRASPVEEYARGAKGTEERRQLLQQLAHGAQDEQIARRLGLSLRTVRRRVAELLEELGADSRFQAGVEAAKRGWL
ncbi:helix-turn-helix domain-containing protein [Nocardioides nematodiphilus]|uniref:helix-turn-helix domain-containing protein n=1 Tax=Nocardioides nematodiphilus TaxID=2849669 RepID=UPI001CDA1977|nr:LuxR C-terminal-related transcriptional regulator [Nocardioides nematodiphilus]MCA1983357.1 LuxR C-terminal-related transcriptional regulator [Nocardioides nematodiphilus]